MVGKSDFVWADLASFDLPKLCDFYTELFAWQYQDDQGYRVCSLDGQAAAGIYRMPERYQKMRMPSFWMSYLQVDDVESVVNKAAAHGAKIEIASERSDHLGKIALIRDPAGAGFTVCEANDISSKSQLGDHGRMVWNELYVSDIKLVSDFYSQVFGWVLKKEHGAAQRYQVFNKQQKNIAAIEVLSNEVKGDKEFWAVYFSVENMLRAKGQIEKNNGRIISLNNTKSGEVLMAQDPAGSVFCLTEGKSKTQSSLLAKPIAKPIKWRAMCAIALVGVAVTMQWQWLWGIIFLAWVIPDLKSGSTHFFETINSKENPLLYWVIVSSWLFLSLYLFSSLLEQ